MVLFKTGLNDDEFEVLNHFGSNETSLPAAEPEFCLANPKKKQGFCVVGTQIMPFLRIFELLDQ